MGDSQKQFDQPRASALGERLIRRATEPLGVIDVSYAQRKYFRLVHWLASRTALLDHITSRYGVEDAFVNSGYPLAVQHPPGQQVNVFSTTSDAAQPDPLHSQASDARPSSLAEIIAERSTVRAGEQEASAQGEFRISRRPVPMSRQSEAVSVPITSRGLPDLALRKDAAEGSDVEKAGAVKSKSAEEKQSAAPVDSPSLRRVSDPDSPGGLFPPATVQHSREDRVAMNPIANQGPPDLILRKTTIEASAVENAGEKHAAIVQLRAPSPQAQSESDLHGAAPRFMAGQPPLEAGAALTNQNSIQPDHRVLAKTQQGGEAPMRALPLVRPPGPRLNAEPGLSPRSGTFAHPTQIDGAQAGEHKTIHPPSMADRRAYVSPEIQEDSLSASMPRIVWRKQEVGAQIADYVARELRASAITDSPGSTQSASASKPAALEGGQNNAQSMPGPRGDEVRIEHISPQVIRTISEQVIRAITLDLKLERERRGLPKWR